MNKAELNFRVDDFFRGETSRLEGFFKELNEVLDKDMFGDMKKRFEDSFKKLNDLASNTISEKECATKMFNVVKDEAERYKVGEKSGDYIFNKEDYKDSKCNLSGKFGPTGHKMFGDPSGIFKFAVNRAVRKDETETEFVLDKDKLVKDNSIKIRTNKNLSAQEKDFCVLIYKLTVFLNLFFRREFTESAIERLTEIIEELNDLKDLEKKIKDTIGETVVSDEDNVSPFLGRAKNVTVSDSINDSEKFIKRVLTIGNDLFELHILASDLLIERKVITTLYAKKISGEYPQYNITPSTKLIDLLKFTICFDKKQRWTI